MTRGVFHCDSLDADSLDEAGVDPRKVLRSRFISASLGRPDDQGPGAENCLFVSFGDTQARPLIVTR